MAHISKLYEFCIDNLNPDTWEIKSPVLKRYLGFFASYGQVFTIEERGEMIGLSVLLRSDILHDFMFALGRGWYFNDYLVGAGKYACTDLFLLKKDIGKKGRVYALKLLRKMFDWGDENKIIGCFTTRTWHGQTNVRYFYKKEVNNGEKLWVCRTLGVHPQGQKDIINA